MAIRPPPTRTALSLTSIVARTFEHLVHYRLMAVLDPAPPPPDPRFPPGHYRFADTQFGFRKSRRTTDAIHYLLTSVQTVIRRDDLSDPKKPRMICPVLFLDLQKAFDRVDHSILLQRLHDAGITGKAWLWIRSFLTGRRMRTVDANEHSEWMQVQYGVPQGCVLSPLLFIVFINDLAISIAHRCPLLSLIFYADDGAIGPNPHASSIDDKAYAARYRENLSTAVSELDHWCDSSRMRFGPKKTQLVLYSTRQSTDPAVPLYNSFQLCGFTISIATHYRYLGVILEHKLQWGMQREAALLKAKQAAQRITRVALRAVQPHLPSIRSLVLGYLIPVFNYGILFWGANLDNATWRSYQSHIARPLRVALNLPTTTHQTSVLHLCGIPSVRSLFVKAELSHLHRAAVVLPAKTPHHPTLLLHRLCLQPPRSNSVPHNLLLPARAVSMAVRLTSDTVPALLASPTLQHLSPAILTPLAVPTPPLPNASPTPTMMCASFWSTPSADRRRWGQTNNFTLHHLLTAITHAVTFARSLTPLHIRHIARWTSVDDWTQQHAVQVAHATTAPLSTCKPSPGLAYHLHHDTSAQAQRRARLLLNRARTGEVLARFHKTGADPVNPSCTHPTCSSPVDPSTPVPTDTVEHMLLHCPRHNSARQRLVHHFNQLTPPLPLSLSTILLATPPPVLKAQRLPLIAHTNSFLDCVVDDRVGLTPLDTG